MKKFGASRTNLTVEQLIALESTGDDEDVRSGIRAILDKHHPGWTLSSARPLWALVRKCDD